MERRHFIKIGGIGATASTVIFPVMAENNKISKDYITEIKRKTPIKGNYDVVVCGAGPAGVTAAISAARSGASTLLVELHGCLGGVWTSGLLSWILDQNNKTGILKQIIDELTIRNAVCPIPTGASLSFDVEEMKLLLEELCINAGVDICLHTRVVDTIKVKDNQLAYIITESKSGREAWGGKIFIDATGDGDLAAMAGCNFDYGDSNNNFAAQPFSLLALIGGVSFDKIKEYTRWKEDIGSGSKKRLLELIKKGGYDPSYNSPGLYPIRDDLFMLMANHEYGFTGYNSKHLTQATLHARKEIHQIIQSLRNTGDAWKNIKLIATAEQIGIREGRRIHGLYTITSQDVVDGKRHKDAVCRATFGIDVHSVHREHEKGDGYNRGLKSQPYDIPLRALISKDVNGIMMAGRCISGDFLAHASYRVTGNASQMGEAAGKVAAKAALTKCLPQDIQWSDTEILK